MRWGRTTSAAAAFGALAVALMVLCGPATSTSSADRHPSGPFSGEATVQRLAPATAGATSAGDPTRSRNRFISVLAAFLAISLLAGGVLSRRSAAASDIRSGLSRWCRQLPMRAPPRLAALSL